MKKNLSAIFSLVILIVLLIGNIFPVYAASEPFDTVIVIDTSGSMAYSMDDMKESAADLCEQIMSKNKDNCIAIISFSDYSNIDCDLTNDETVISQAIDNLYSEGCTDMYDSVVSCFEILNNTNHSGRKQNVIIMADGNPNTGSNISEGKYTSKYPTEPYLAAYANAVLDYVVTNIHPIADVYTIGYYDFDPNGIGIDLYENEQLAIEFIKDLANMKTYFPSEANEIFKDVAVDVIETTTVPVTTTEKQTTTTTTTTTQISTSNVVIADSDENNGGGSGTIVAIGVGSVCGFGGLIALIIFLLTRKPKPPIVPIMAPMIIPSDDDDDDENDTRYQKDSYSAPVGIDSFASNAVADNAYGLAAVASVYGVSGTYRGDSFDINDGDIITVGRDAKECNLVINSDNSKVSRVHCTIAYDSMEKKYNVTDLSKNGTFTKKTKLPYNVPTPLPVGTEIQLANSSNIFRLE